MPTGYTAPIYEGQDLSLSEYAQRCARAFGALITLRDEPLTNSIPDRIESTTFYRDALVKIQKEYDDFLANPPTIEYAETEYEKLVAKYNKDRTERNEKAKALETRYRKLLDEVNAWQPPTPEHTGLKDFMVRQLEQSIDGDCRIPDKSYIPDKEDFVKEMITGESLKRRLGYYSESAEKEALSAEKTNLWIKQLKESLK